MPSPERAQPQELANLMEFRTPPLAQMGSRVSSEPAIPSGSPATRSPRNRIPKAKVTETGP